MFGLPAAAMSVGNQSRPEKIPFSTVPGLICPGQRIMAGTRKPPSPTVPLVFLNDVMPPSRPREHLRAVIRGEDDDRVVGLADVVEMLQQCADAVIQLRHTGFLETVVGLAVLHRAVFLRQEGPDVHA